MNRDLIAMYWYGAAWRGQNAIDLHVHKLRFQHWETSLLQ